MSRPNTPPCSLSSLACMFPLHVAADCPYWFPVIGQPCTTPRLFPSLFHILRNSQQLDVVLVGGWIVL